MRNYSNWKKIKSWRPWLKLFVVNTCDGRRLFTKFQLNRSGGTSRSGAKHFLAKNTCRMTKIEDLSSETTTNECRSSAVAWFWCHTWYLKSAVSAVHQLQVAKLEAFHIASVAHHSSYKFAFKANGDGFIQKSADSADGQLQVAKLQVFCIASVAHKTSYKHGPKANSDGPI